jgi:hypothetical protein
MALRNASTATPEAIQKLAETNLYLLAKNKKQEARIQRLREALEKIAERFVQDPLWVPGTLKQIAQYGIKRGEIAREALAADLEGGKDE